MLRVKRPAIRWSHMHENDCLGNPTKHAFDKRCFSAKHSNVAFCDFLKCKSSWLEWRNNDLKQDWCFRRRSVIGGGLGRINTRPASPNRSKKGLRPQIGAKKGLCPQIGAKKVCVPKSEQRKLKINQESCLCSQIARILLSCKAVQHRARCPSPSCRPPHPPEVTCRTTGRSRSTRRRTKCRARRDRPTPLTFTLLKVWRHNGLSRWSKWGTFLPTPRKCFKYWYVLNEAESGQRSAARVKVSCEGWRNPSSDFSFCCEAPPHCSRLFSENLAMTGWRGLCAV